MKNIQTIIAGTVLVAAAHTLSAQTQFNPAPSRIVGQAILQQQGTPTAIAPNLVEGREFNLPFGVAIDTTAMPPILYVADALNNRVLAWSNAAGFTKGDKADKVIGQRDFFSTASQGPAGGSSALSTGLAAPVAVAVDSSGNLYVADAGNNRIIRYPKPLSQTGDLLTVDLILGQSDTSSFTANQGLSAPTSHTLSLGLGEGMAFDAQGNLWVSDSGNNRVLRYPASSLTSGSSFDPAADLVLGHNDFTTSAVPANSTRIGKNFLSQPAGLAFDPKGRLFVADGPNRVDVFVPPFSSGMSITRIMGVVIPASGQTAPIINESTLGSNTTAAPPNSVFFIGDKPYVVDTYNARILGYDSFDNWPDEGTAFSPPAKVVIGQPSFQAFLSNQGLPQPTASTLAGPSLLAPPALQDATVRGPAGAFFFGTDLYVADTGNNRVLVFPQQSGGTFTAATRLLGQVDFQYNTLNLIEGREFDFSGTTGACIVNGAYQFTVGGAVAIDPSSNPPHMYVADVRNNRVLGFLDYRKVNAGTKADLVIGQPDLMTSIANYPGTVPGQTNDSGLWSPANVVVDANGDVYVADSCNARVVRFPQPFAQTQGVMPHANLVIGQTSLFGTPVKDISRQTMKSSYGIAFSEDGHLLVSDPLANRVLLFLKPKGGDFQSGASASNVFGQKDFSSLTPTVFSNPRQLAVDPDDQLYVADAGNGRVAILPNIPTAGDNPPVLYSITGLNNPYGVTINTTTFEVWISSTLSNQVLRYPRYALIVGGAAPTATLTVSGPLAVGLDPFGNPAVVEGAIHRVSFYFPAIDYTSSANGVAGRYSGNAANYFARFAPGMLASIFPFTTSSFNDQTVTNNTLPIPTVLGDVQVTVAGVPSPLLYVSRTQINFQVPKDTPTGSLQEIQVSRVSTGQILASYLFRIDTVSPGLFTTSSTGTGQVAALNQDGSINSGTKPAKAGTYISLFGTGQGTVPGMPADGQPNPPGAVPTPQLPKVSINGSDFLPDTEVQYSGLAPGFVGLWQINVRIPANVPANADVPVFVQLNSINSVTDPYATGLSRHTTIRVTQ